MAPGSQPLSDDQMRRTRALVDILTSLKRRANHPPPTEELILRNFDALSLPALNTLSILIDHTTAGQHRRRPASGSKRSRTNQPLAGAGFGEMMDWILQQPE